MADDEGKFKESIWAINPDWRGWFYGVLSFCVFVVFILTLVDEWSKVVFILTLADEWSKVVFILTLADEWSKNWLDIFDVLWNRILGSVIVVWFVFQVMELAMGAYQYFMDLKKARRQEALKKFCQEAEEYRKRRKELYNEGLMKAGVSEEQIRQAEQHSSGLGPFSPSIE